jgi:hypothetical protein
MVMKNLKPKNTLQLPRSFINKFNFKRLSAVIASGFMFTILAPIILVDTVSAYGQVQSRSIQISDSNVSGSGGGTGVTYKVSFLPVSTNNLGGIIIDFCSNDPIIGDTCTAPAGFTLGGAAPASNVTSGIGTGGTWGAVATGSFNILFETNATPQAITGITTPIVLTITGVTNPSTLGSFYARILTYDTQANANAYTPTNLGSGTQDAGGVALSTVNTITVTSKVQEVLTFCVYTTAFDNGACTGTGSTVTLGNKQGVLSTAGPYVDNSTKYDIQSNALHGVVIRFTGTVPTSGSNVIESSALSGMGAAASTSYASTNGNPQFGLCNWSAGGTTTNLTPAAPYNDANCNTTTQTAGPLQSGATGGVGTANFAFNIANATSTYGDILANAVAGTYAEGQLAFVGNISNTTVAGIYQTVLTFIATGSY